MFKHKTGKYRFLMSKIRNTVNTAEDQEKPSRPVSWLPFGHKVWSFSDLTNNINQEFFSD